MFNTAAPGNYFSQLYANPNYTRQFFPQFRGQMSNEAPVTSGAPANRGFDWKKIFGLAALGGGIGGLLGGAGKSSGMYGSAMDKYRGHMAEALKALQEHEAMGRGDITKYLGEAQEFGAPYRQAGISGLTSYLGSLGIGGEGARQAAMQSFHEAPGYRYALNQALQQAQRTMAPGMRGSAAEKLALMREAQGMAEQQYGGWQKQLAGLAGMGQTSAEAAAQRQYGAGGALANLGLQYGGRLSDLYGQMAKSEAEAEMARQQAEAERRGGWWKGIGSLLGAAAGHFLKI